jgi:hypothetical protein
MKKYCPSNGNEGMWFTGIFCDQCEADRIYRETQKSGAGCDILARSMLFDVSDKEYPGEWQIGEAGRPICTAFLRELTAEERAANRKREYMKKLEGMGQMTLFSSTETCD